MVPLAEAATPRPVTIYPKVVIDTGPLISILVLKYAFILAPDAAVAIITRSRIAPYFSIELVGIEAAGRKLDSHSGA